MPGQQNIKEKFWPVCVSVGVWQQCTWACHKFCYNSQVFQSWRQRGGRVVRKPVFGLLSLQVLVSRQFALARHSLNMEWVVEENHVSVVVLHNCGKSHSQIFRLTMEISRMFIYRGSRVAQLV